jgi:plasmid stabilization system protein ParE
VRTVRTVPVADDEIREIDDWWRENRTAAPDLFLDELTLALHLLRDAPFVGVAYDDADLAGVRRVLLRSTRNHVYYVVTRDEVVVVSVWGAIKGTGPNLAGRFPDE